MDEAFDIEDRQRLIVTGYASKLGDTKNKPKLIADARNLGKRMGEIIRG